MKNAKIIIPLFYILILAFISCDKEEEITRGFYMDKNHYQIIAYGKAPQHITKKVQARNMAKETAIIAAQQKAEEEFSIPANKIIKSGVIKKVEFKNNYICRLIYIININTLKKDSSLTNN